MTKRETVQALRWLSPLVADLVAVPEGRWFSVEGTFAGTVSVRFQTLDQVRGFIADPLLVALGERSRAAA